MPRTTIDKATKFFRNLRYDSNGTEVVIKVDSSELLVNNGAGSTLSFGEWCDTLAQAFSVAAGRTTSNKRDAVTAAMCLAAIPTVCRGDDGRPVEVVARWYDASLGRQKSVPVMDLVGLAKSAAQKAVPPVAEVDLGELEDSFRRDVLNSEYQWDANNLDILALDGVTSLGSVRPVSWITKPPDLSNVTELKDDTDFKTGNGALRLVDSKSEGEMLKEKRQFKVLDANGTGLDEHSLFVWCPLTMKQFNSWNREKLFTAMGIANETADSGITFMDGLYSAPHLHIEHLRAKAISAGVIGPMQISANVLPVVPSTDEVVFMQKSEGSKPFHTPGGGYAAQRPSNSNKSKTVFDGGDIVRCARRETAEEVDLFLTYDTLLPFEQIPCLMILQSQPSFIQFVFLGWPCGEAENARSLKSPIPEGRRVAFNRHSGSPHNFESTLDPKFRRASQRRHEWRPAGLLALHAWTELGYPGLTSKKPAPAS